MDSRAETFVWVMVGIAVVGILGFLVGLIARRFHPVESDATQRPDRTGSPPPLAVVPAIVVTLTAAGIVVWQLPEIMGTRGAELDMSGQGRHAGFLIAMLVVAVVALIAMVAVMFVRAAGGARENAADAAPIRRGDTEIEAPSAVRLVGLLGLALAVLLLCWIYLPAARQYGLMLHLVYPAAFAVALVLLFDKATRGWSAKTGADGMREWLMCGLFAFLLVLGFLNLEGSGAGDKYASALWDVVHVALFFIAFWMVDRKLTRFRFLLGYGYLVALPVLLLIWRAQQGIGAPDGISWWETPWPVFFLAVIFFALEAVVLIASRERRAGGGAAIRDAVFVAAYAIVLINAVPGDGG
jgi:hypothetical protein